MKIVNNPVHKTGADREFTLTQWKKKKDKMICTFQLKQFVCCVMCRTSEVPISFELGAFTLTFIASELQFSK